LITSYIGADSSICKISDVSGFSRAVEDSADVAQVRIVGAALRVVGECDLGQDRAAEAERELALHHLQLLSSLAIDHFGLVGVVTRQVSGIKLAGGFVMLTGVLLTLYGNSLVQALTKNS
jgi:hypothetical protein